MLESRDFVTSERIYMPLKLAGPSSGGILKISAELLTSPPPPPPEPTEVENVPSTIEEIEPIIIIEPIEEILVETPTGVIDRTLDTTSTTLTVPGGTTTTIEETQPVTTVTTRTEPTVTTIAPREDFGSAWTQFFTDKRFIGEDMMKSSVFNIWIGRAAVLVFSEGYNSTFEISIPINFFQETILMETAEESPPITVGGGGDDSEEGTFSRAFGNPLELGDFGSILLGDKAQTYTFGDELPVVEQTLNVGFHPAFLEVVTNGNTWRVHVEIEYEYERIGTAAEWEDPPIIRNILINKKYAGFSSISWNTDVKADRNWVVYGIGSLESPTNSITKEAPTDTLYPGRRLPMDDNTSYNIQVFSELKGRVSNSEVFTWFMPPASVSKTSDLEPKANSGGELGEGLIGDGVRVTDIEGGEEEQIIKPADFPILPIIAIGGVAIVGLGGVALFLMKRSKS